MGALWATNDALTQERMNRGAIIGRLLFPAYDVDDAAAIKVTAKPVDGVALPSSSAAQYTVPGSGVAVAEILTITLANTDSVARVVSVDLVPSGGSPGVATAIFRDIVEAGETVELEGPWFIEASDSLRCFAAAAAVVSMRAEVLEYAAAPAGVTLKVIDGVALGSSVSTYYTVPGSGVTHSVLLSHALCNTDSVTRTPNVHVIPSGGSAAVANRIWSGGLAAAASAIVGPNALLEPGDFIQAKADSASVVGLRLTVVEFA